MSKKEKKKDKEKGGGGSSSKRAAVLPEPLETQRHYVICGPDQNSHVSCSCVWLMLCWGVVIFVVVCLCFCVWRGIWTDASIGSHSGTASSAALTRTHTRVVQQLRADGPGVSSLCLRRCKEAAACATLQQQQSVAVPCMQTKLSVAA
jgi:hypothetical protein